MHGAEQGGHRARRGDVVLLCAGGGEGIGGVFQLARHLGQLLIREIAGREDGADEVAAVVFQGEGLGAERAHGRFDDGGAADQIDDHIGSRVVADDDHEGEQVEQRGGEAGFEMGKDAAAGRFGGVEQAAAVIQAQAAGGDLLEGGDEDGHLEGAGHGVEGVGVQGGFFAGLQVVDEDAQLAAAIALDLRQAFGQGHGQAPSRTVNVQLPVSVSMVVPGP